MKDFVKMTLATLAGLFLFGFVALFIIIGAVGAVASLGTSEPAIPTEGMLKIDMSAITLAEQTSEADPFASISGKQIITPVGIYSAIKKLTTEFKNNPKFNVVAPAA